MFPAKFKKLLEGGSHDIMPANKETNPRRMVTKLDQSCLTYSICGCGRGCRSWMIIMLVWCLAPSLTMHLQPGTSPNWVDNVRAGPSLSGIEYSLWWSKVSAHSLSMLYTYALYIAESIPPDPETWFMEIKLSESPGLTHDLLWMKRASPIGWDNKIIIQNSKHDVRHFLCWFGWVCLVPWAYEDHIHIASNKKGHWIRENHTWSYHMTILDYLNASLGI